MHVANVALEVTNLDFEGIKTNLKNYLKSKDTFADFDFDHSNLSVLMDVMAYNSFLPIVPSLSISSRMNSLWRA